MTISAERTRVEKQLDAWPESAAETLELIEHFARMTQKHADHYELSLSLFYVQVSRKEVDAVLQADDRVAAAGDLCSKKLNRWD